METKDSSIGRFPTYCGDEILCHCMSLKRRDVNPMLSGKRRQDVDKIMNWTGGGTVCSSCRPLFYEMVGESVWQNVELTEIKSLARDIKSFRFESNEPFAPAQAGQHILLQGYVNDRWEQRSYTITSAGEEQNYREVIVKKYSDGVFSNWLHSIDVSDNDFFRISLPLGNEVPNLVSNQPLVCFVAGIGVTPAIAFVRTILEQSRRPFRKVLIDYTTNNANQIICHQELMRAQSNEHISVDFRVIKSKINGQFEENNSRVNENTVLQIVKSNPRCDYFVCGPLGYIDAVVSYLKSARVPSSNITIESFAASDRYNPGKNLNDLYLAVFLFCAFIIQDTLNLKIHWLEILQTQDSYKNYSGAFFLIYMLSLFILPYTKLSIQARFLAKVYRKHRHRGALSPLFFYLHSTELGSAYVLGVSLCYFATFLSGIFNHELIKDATQRMRYFKLWLPLHITLSIITMSLIGFHIYVVSSY